ncbi:putative membrane protein [Lyngbya aestuarii BL J]|uniref:Putative membrane protein n=1 Tax=Lyngbya aestuarii BL J TaxID=1348334 RepID=U7QRA2_9CYAN|nr:putative membrane protein [Lyngbya aestuarii BL J]
MQKKTYYLASSIFFIVGLLWMFIKLIANTERFTVIMIGCFLVGLVYFFLGSRLKN